MADSEHSVKVLRVLEEDYQPTCACAAKKCGPHLCWPSRWAWGIVMVLLAYAVVMHSFQMAERAERWGAIEAKLLLKVDGLLQDFRLTQEHSLLQVSEERLNRSLHDIRQEHQAALALVRRAEGLSWAVATPDLERDRQLKEALDALQTK